VGRDHHRHALAGEAAHDLEHLGDELRVKGARDLVEEHQPRPGREGAHDRDPLLLAAGEAVGVVVHLLRQPESRQQVARLGLRVRPRHAERPAWA
jgi:hypothetical protein